MSTSAPARPKGLQSDFEEEIDSLLQEFLTTPAKSQKDDFEPDPLQDRLFRALVESYTSSSMSLCFGGCGCLCEDHHGSNEESSYYPYLNRFLADPPKSLTNLDMAFEDPRYFLSFPDAIGGTGTNLTTVSITNDMENETSNGGHDSLGRLLYCTRFIQKVDLYEFHPSHGDCEFFSSEWDVPRMFESRTESLYIQGSQICCEDAVILHEKTTFPRLKVLDICAIQLGPGVNPLEFWKQILSKAANSLKELHYHEDIEDSDSPSARLFPTLCIALSRQGSMPVGLERMDLRGVCPNTLFHLELVARSSIGWTLKNLAIYGYLLEPCLAPTIAAFRCLESLRVDLEHYNHPLQYRLGETRLTNFLVDYSKSSLGTQNLKKLIIYYADLITSIFRTTCWPTVEELVLVQTGLGHGKNTTGDDDSSALFPFKKVFPALKTLNLLKEESISSKVVEHIICSAPLLQLLKVRGVVVPSPEKAQSYSLLKKMVKAKQNLFDLDLTFKQSDGSKGLDHQQKFEKHVRLYTFLHRIDESLKDSTPSVPVGLYPHILEKCEGRTGTTGLYLALKDKLLLGIGFS